jgi:uncharacterized protein (TIRG00374 family)
MLTIGGQDTAGDDPPCPDDADQDLPEVPPPLGDAGPCERPDTRLRRGLRIAVPLLIGAGVVFVLVVSVGDLSGALRVIRDMDPRLVGVAAFMEATSYGFLTLHLRCLAGPAANARRVAPMRTALVVFGLGSVLPAAPAEGLAMAGATLKKRRVDRRRIALLLGFSQWFSTRGLFALAAIDAVIVSVAADVPGRYRMGVLLSGLVGLAALAGTTWLAGRRRCAEWAALVLGRVRYWRHCPPAAERRARGAAWHAVAMHVAGQRRDRALLLGTMVAAWAMDGLCLHFALLAAGAHVSVDILLLAYAAGAICASVPLLPAGVGVVETVTPLILVHYGVPLPAAVGAVIAYRLLATLLPAAAGGLALIGLQLEAEAPDDTGPVAAELPDLAAAGPAAAEPAGPATGALAAGEPQAVTSGALMAG